MVYFADFSGSGTDGAMTFSAFSSKGHPTLAAVVWSEVHRKRDRILADQAERAQVRLVIRI